jgi:TPR repeat protein
LFQKAVLAGHLKAHNSLGVCYVLGFGVKKDVAKGIELFELAATRGDGNAMFNLGNAHVKGQGVAIDLPKALVLYEKAAALEDIDAMYLLGIWYLEGTNVTKDYSEVVAKMRGRWSCKGDKLLGNLLQHWLRSQEGPRAGA